MESSRICIDCSAEGSSEVSLGGSVVSLSCARKHGLFSSAFLCKRHRALRRRHDANTCCFTQFSGVDSVTTLDCRSRFRDSVTTLDCRSRSLRTISHRAAALLDDEGDRLLGQ